VSVAEVARRIRAGELSPREAVESYLERIEQLDGAINAYVSVRGDEALTEADRAPEGPLRGVPVAIKDVIDVAGAATTAASRILAGNVAARDAACVERLRRSGAIVLGKLNTHEFAFGATTTSPHFGAARNPWALERICGGSSGGSGAAAAADMAAGTLGTDTAGSIRIPACFCGVTGLRPSTGLVPTEGVVPVSWSLDTVGPIARSAEDCALLLAALTGEPVELGDGVRGLRIGVIDELFDRAEPAVAEQGRAAVEELRALGAAVEPVEVPLLEESGTMTQLLMLPEAAEVHLPWLRTRIADYGEDVRARLLAGLLMPATAHVTGLRARRWFRDELGRLFDRVDLLAAPEMPIVPPPIGRNDVDVRGERMPYRLSLIPFNSPWALAGLPVASMPAGFVDGLPVGLALVGRPGEEATVLQAVHAFQRATDWHERRPPPAEVHATAPTVSGARPPNE
jgi:aspartyl-tRNA(Asn)/glutamyl-tRNA(Gln) amidotransferase subunit A